MFYSPERYTMQEEIVMIDLNSLLFFNGCFSDGFSDCFPTVFSRFSHGFLTVFSLFSDRFSVIVSEFLNFRIRNSV